MLAGLKTRAPFLLEPLCDLGDHIIRAHHVVLRALELPNLKADGDGAIDAGLREIDAPVGVDSFDKREVERIDIGAALRGA